MYHMKHYSLLATHVDHVVHKTSRLETEVRVDTVIERSGELRDRGVVVRDGPKDVVTAGVSTVVDVSQEMVGK